MHIAETFLQVNSDNDDFDLSMDDLTNNFNFINNLNNNSSTSHHLPHHTHAHVHLDINFHSETLTLHYRQLTTQRKLLAHIDEFPSLVLLFANDREAIVHACRVNTKALQFIDDNDEGVAGGGDDRYMLLRDVNVIQRIVEETKGDVAFRPLIKYIYNRRDLLLIALKNRLGLNELDEYYEKKGIIPFYCSDRDFMMQAVKMSGHHLSFASDTLKKDRELVLEAVKSDGNAIFLDHCFGLDREIVFTALKSKYLVTIDFFNNVWFNDREFVEYAVKYKARVLKKVSSVLKLIM